MKEIRVQFIQSKLVTYFFGGIEVMAATIQSTHKDVAALARDAVAVGVSFEFIEEALAIN